MENPATLLSWPHDWSFIQGTPGADWEKSYHDGKKFHLDACIDLDKLCDAPVIPDKSEGVLYAKFATGNAGIVRFGIGCNWCVEAYCDGQLVISTYETGNGFTYVFPSNHRIEFAVSAGEHILAFKCRRGTHNWNFTFGGVSFDIPEEPAILYGPWLANPDTGRVTVGFTFNQPLGAGIAYRKKGDGDWLMAWHHRQGQCLRRTYHAVPLTDLEPGATYEYKIITIHPDNYGEIQLGDIHSFRAPDAEKSTFSFFFTADLQFSLKRQHDIFGKMLDAAKADECDFFILDGDVNSAFLPENVIRGPFAQLCEHGAAEKPLIYVRGNHELRGDAGDQFLDYFATNIGTTYDIIRLGDTAFLLLDSWEDKPAKTPGHTYCQWNLDDWFIKTETEWLKTATKDPKWTTAKRRFLICHGAAYSHHDSCRTMPYVLQKMTDPIFGGKNPLSRLNLWLAGHVHCYLRSIPGSNDIVSPTTPPRPFKGGLDYTYPVLTVAGPGARKIQASCFRIDADQNGFNVRSWDDEGNLLEDIRYDNDGTCTERVALPHFTTEPENP